MRHHAKHIASLVEDARDVAQEQRLTVAMRKFQCDGQRPSVQEVAQACGYANLSHFSRDFKARFGINPSSAKRL